MSTRPGQPLVVAGALLLAIVGATVVAERVLGAPRREVELLAAFLSASGILSLVVGALAIRWAGRRIPSLHVRLTLAYGIGLVVALVNVVTTSALMFLSAHDLALLSLLLVFAAVISVAFAYAVAGALTADLGALSHAAQLRFDARHQLARAERFDHVIVGADAKPGDAVGLLAARGEQDDG